MGFFGEKFFVEVYEKNFVKICIFAKFLVKNRKVTYKILENFAKHHRISTKLHRCNVCNLVAIRITRIAHPSSLTWCRTWFLSPTVQKTENRPKMHSSGDTTCICNFHDEMLADIQKRFARLYFSHVQHLSVKNRIGNGCSQPKLPNSTLADGQNSKILPSCKNFRSKNRTR